MPAILTQQELITRLLEILKSTSLPFERLQKMASAAFNKNLYTDMVPFFHVEPNGYTVRIHERGVLIREWHTEQVEEVLYVLLEQLIYESVYLYLMDKYKADNPTSRLLFTPEIKKEVRATIDEAFTRIGGVFDEWHRAGKQFL